MKVYSVRDRIYNQDVNFVVGGSHEDVTKYILRKHERIEKGLDYAEAVVFRVNNKEENYRSYYLWIENFNLRGPLKNIIENLAILSHESQHLGVTVMNDMGMRFNASSEEAYVQYCEMIFKRCALKVCPKPKLKKKNRRS